jgi:uncharacterized protein YkwD
MPIATLNFARAGLAALAVLVLAACSGGGGALPGGLTQRMDQAGASFDRMQALAILNDYRATTGAPPLAADQLLDTAATDLAISYARTGTPPKLGPGVLGMRTSAGYVNFAETFSGWRNSPEDAAVIANRTATRAGLGVTYSANSAYGVYWVLVLDD